jgi:predicted SAM-dependent methyltransferase
MTLNLGCGTRKIEGCINVDTFGKPDVCANILHLPFKSETIDKIYLFHTIEHIEDIKHYDLFMEFRRILKDNGELIISYPEFTKCAQNFIENKNGDRVFWGRTIYGRQSYPGDYHVALMYTPWFKNFLRDVGFNDIKDFPEPGEPYNTVIKCKKDIRPLSLVERYKRDIFAN